MKTGKKLYDSIKIEDNLPSFAGDYFRHLIKGWLASVPVDDKHDTIGYREMLIIADWMKYFANMPAIERDAFIRMIDNENA